jgi:2-iminobutanoate/2-iminopropanoate deaminase
LGIWCSFLDRLASILRPVSQLGETFDEQARQVFRNLDEVLRAAGSSARLVVNTTVLVSDMSSFPELNKLFGEFFSENPPARMTMQVPLPQGLLLSIGCVAAVES